MCYMCRRRPVVGTGTYSISSKLITSKAHYKQSAGPSNVQDNKENNGVSTYSTFYDDLQRRPHRRPPWQPERREKCAATG